MEPAVEALLADDAQSSSVCFSSGGDAHGLQKIEFGQGVLVNETDDNARGDWLENARHG